MNDFSERRKYKRSDHIVCEALITVGDGQWIEAELLDVSAGGLRFFAGQDFNIDDQLSIKLEVYNMLSQFHIKLHGRILRVDNEGGRQAYVVRFQNTDKYTQVQLDELVRNSLMFRNAHEPVFREEQYSLLLLPRFGLKHGKVRK